MGIYGRVHWILDTIVPQSGYIESKNTYLSFHSIGNNCPNIYFGNLQKPLY